MRTQVGDDEALALGHAVARLAQGAGVVTVQDDGDEWFIYGSDGQEEPIAILRGKIVTEDLDRRIVTDISL